MLEKFSKLNLSKKKIVIISICILSLIIFAFQIPTIIRKCSLTKSNKESIRCVESALTPKRKKSENLLKSDLIRIIDANGMTYDFFTLEIYPEKYADTNIYFYKNSHYSGRLVECCKPLYVQSTEGEKCFNECKYVYDTYCYLGNNMETLDKYDKIEVLNREIVAAELGIDYEY